MVNALEAGTIVAVMAGVVGWFMVLRSQTFAGHTLSVMAFPGATGALLIGLSAAVGYFVFSGLAALVIGVAAGATARRSRGQESAITGAVQAFGLACGFLFLSLYQGVLANYESLLFGSFLGITSDRFWRSPASPWSRSCCLRSLDGRCCSSRSTRAWRARAACRPARSASASCCCWAWPSQRPRRSRERCWCSRCSSRPPRRPS